MQSHLFVLIFAVSLVTASCDSDGVKQGFRGPCSASTGDLIGCQRPIIESVEDVCWRLVECGSIPVESDEDFVFDWDNCVRVVENRDDYERDYIMSCVRAASCDELKDDNSPNNPGPPICFEFRIDPREDSPQ